MKLLPEQQAFTTAGSSTYRQTRKSWWHRLNVLQLEISVLCLTDVGLKLDSYLWQRRWPACAKAMSGSVCSSERRQSQPFLHLLR